MISQYFKNIQQSFSSLQKIAMLIILLKKGVVYEGDFTTEHLTEWIIENSRQDIILRKIDNKDDINKFEDEKKIVSVEAGEDRVFNFD